MNDILYNYVNQEILGERAGIELSGEDDLLGSGLIDSMSMMKFINFIEDEFHLQVPPEDMTIENFMTLNAISDYLKKRKKD